MNTWPFSFVSVTEVFRGGYKHLSIRHWRPERHHVVAPVVTNRGIFFRILRQICREILTVSWKANCAYKKAVKYAGFIIRFCCEMDLNRVSSTIHQIWHQCRCGEGQRWGHWERGESVLRCHSETDGPGCGGSSPRDHSSPGGRCSLSKQQDLIKEEQKHCMKLIKKKLRKEKEREKKYLCSHLQLCFWSSRRRWSSRAVCQKR